MNDGRKGEIMRRPKSFKTGLATILTASLISTTAMPALADSVPVITNSDDPNAEVKETEVSKTPTNLEEAQAYLKEAEAALNAATAARSTATANLNTKNDLVSNVKVSLTNAEQKSIDAFANVVEENLKNVEEKQDALDKAEADLDSAETSKDEAADAYAKAVSAKEAAEEVLKSATDDKNAKEEALAKAEADEESARAVYESALAEYNEAKAAYDKAKADTDSAKTAYDNALEEVEDLTSEKEAKEAELSDAKAALEKAKSDLALIDENSDEYTAAAAVVKQKEADLLKKEDTLQTVTERLSKAEKDLAAKKSAYESAKSVLDDRNTLVENVNSAESALNEASAVLEVKEAAKDAAESEYKACEDAVAAASAELKKASTDLTAAEAAETSAETLLKEAQERYESEKAAAAKALEEANAAYAEEGKNFLSENLSGGVTYDSMLEGALNNVQLNWYGVFDTEDGVEWFKTKLAEFLTVKNLLASAELSKTGNAYREQEGVGALMLDYNLMMFSAFCNAGATMVFNHTLASDRGIAGIPNTGAGSGENLAAASGDPYDVWYIDEKRYMEEELAKKEADPTYTIKYSRYGHYRTLIKDSYKVTGISTNGHFSEQFFYAGNVGIAVTPDEFIAALKAYAAPFEKAVSDASALVESLESKPDYLLKAEEAYAKALAAVTEATEKKADAENNPCRCQQQTRCSRNRT